MKLINSPVGGEAQEDISHGGKLLNAEAEIEFGAGRVFAPFDEKHPAAIDGGLLKVAYDGGSDAIQIKPFTLRWDESLLTIAGSIGHKTDPRTNQLVWSVDLDGSGTKLGASDFAVRPIAMDSFKIAGAYDAAADSIVLDDFHIQAGSARVAFEGRASTIRSGGAVTLNGTVCQCVWPSSKRMWPPLWRTARANGSAATCLPERSRAEASRLNCPQPISRSSRMAATYPIRP